jgi:hypothetical protein
MTTQRINTGLLPASELVTIAANDAGMDRAVRTPAGRRDTDDHGWDPFEVWRTRVKEARERFVPPAVDRQRKN